MSLAHSSLLVCERCHMAEDPLLPGYDTMLNGTQTDIDISKKRASSLVFHVKPKLVSCGQPIPISPDDMPTITGIR